MAKYLKRGLALLLAGIITFTSLGLRENIFAAGAEEYTDSTGAWNYTLNEEGQAEIIGFNYSKTGDTLQIPSEVDSHQVISIGTSMKSASNKSKIKSVSLPSSVKTIQEQAFYSYAALATVDLNQVEEIGEKAFG